MAPTKAELVTELSAAEKRVAKLEKAKGKAVPKTPKASLDALEAMTADLLAEDGYADDVRYHLTKVQSSLRSIRDAQDTQARMERPEGE